MNFINVIYNEETEQVEGFEFVEDIELTPIQQIAFESLTGNVENKPFLTEEEEEYFKKIHSIAFLDFLFDHINPNEMEDYISMYLSTDKKGKAKT